MKTPVQLLITHKLTENQLRRITDVSPDVVVHYIPRYAEAKQFFSSADILFGEIPREQFLQMQSLQWVQISTVGADRFLYPELLQSDVILCCSRGMHKYQMTELLFGLMVGIVRKLFSYHDLQKEAEWTAALLGDSDIIRGRTLGIVGLGSIGSHMAKVAKSFGMNVLGMKRTPEPVECVDEVLPPSQLEKLLRNSDHVVNVTPLTPETTKLFGAKEFSMMKSSAVFYNLGRGASIDERALMEALERGTIKAAALDVFEEEPLPKDHPLWKTKNIFITPHVGGPIPHYNHLLTEIFIENLKRSLAGRPLATVVDKAKGY
jgi:phosphoglycerate dehydrogenase-like enzyme